MTDKGARVVIQIQIKNMSGSLSKIILEPWADEIEIRKSDQFALVASGPSEGAMIEQIYEGDVIIINAWHGATFAVSLNGKAVFTGSREFPAL